LSPAIKPGMRAISIRVNEVIGVAGFVVPGSRVDIVTILKGVAGGDPFPFSRVVVSNVTVLSAGTRYDQEDARTNANAIRSTVVTLMVSPLDADRIALAQSTGELMLTLRHPLDADPTADARGIRMAAMFAGEEVAPKPAPTGLRRVAAPLPPPPPPPPVVKAYTVETIRAAKRSEETLLGGYVAR